MPFSCFLLVLIIAMMALGFFRATLIIWTGILASLLLVVSLGGLQSPAMLGLIWLVFALIFLPLNILPLRRQYISRPIFAVFRGMMPPMSETERQALEAGTVWWDAELFSGKPDWRKLLNQPSPSLSAEEQAFLDGPTEALCGMLNDWEINHELHDLPPDVWQFIRQQGFFGMIIPKQYGGLEFSAQAHSAVVMKVASRSTTAAVTVMVPNSLGPGQLLMNYGTEEQKNHYLPRLASGTDIPCFALTSPWAGSDAAAMRDTGIVCRGEFEGREIIGIRLNWEKRYITLAPVATVLGLAFKLFDPEHLLGEEEERGITLALIPTDTAGVEKGRRHLPLDQAFQNGPVEGHDVFIPLDWIIGGTEFAGQGWRMLMECLADGRAISLPSLSAGAGKLCARATGSYARIRSQFHTPIGRMEGVEEALARIAGNTYAIDAVRQLTGIAVDQGEKPSVMSAIAKYHCTERMRSVVNDAMDVFGGTAISMGPLNLLARTYEAIPISITVEGANILTRSLIIFGQGVIRCHPWLRQEMDAVSMHNEEEALKAFDHALFAHIGFAGSNKVRSILLGLSNGLLSTPPLSGPAHRYARHIERYSANLAWASDVTLAVLGGGLKRRESLSGRLGDVLAQLYIASAAIKHFVSAGSPPEDEVLLSWVCEDALWRAEQALDAFLNNFPQQGIALLMRAMVFPLGRRRRAPDDRLGHAVAASILEPGAARDRLTEGIYLNSRRDDPLGRIEQAFDAVLKASDAEAKLRKARKDAPAGEDEDAAISRLQGENVLSAEEISLLHDAREAIRQAIIVDSFAA
ncbi:MAG: acyl-CoA dehydrogenase [Zetaproteobacteria bacterium CG12_big_fil_rev_8_21_14_0_65_55_1124]|nr:MAG: acyl-CoA dehydrogenase [Zetaproteobacteria bacterium CG08_land_8_20_14_0_20_55_17]PIW41803.1 MAG: acyl-CoA dehydrogenase [Zetaproteobacteria bacterium CG12_big_fil_rev_8_21_14_0_65_55_1124]PIY54508.1 MAG: acyl-CoA dehydrogenase [Zetaproteobacteria bacterium CG_4_10_14_0_8_um_filter_55_43]PIZ39066.1 MAG: acyl-CoA dehydrogenase [Zetaproteobacteria bacterium CG_4_10_14_0_2_um_filter_55_20]PJB82642.1 MAG: acyl-CoA dehydrogenase [Zetaproteobacteria bacterium CG_4_9_14_0_8_um_filter_55_31]